MKLRAILLTIGLAALLGGCMDIDLDPFDDDAPDTTAATAVQQPNGCTAQGCPQAGQFCQARGYTPGTDGYDRCVISVNQNLRNGTQ